MTDFEVVLANELHEKFLETKRLDEVEAKNDPENEPYKSRYKSREIFLELKTIVESHKSENPNEDRWTFLLAAVYLKLGVNYNDTEETSCGEEHLTKCVELLESSRSDKRCVNVLQSGLNQIGVLWAGRRNYETAQEFLERAERLYTEFKHEVGSTPMFVEELFIPTQEDSEEANEHRRKENFEETYTYTMYYLAQVYGKLSQNDKSASYCHMTLHRQLATMKYDPLDWALNAATLSQYYITSNNFPLARHCLASASVIIQEVPEPNADDMLQEDVDNKKEKVLQGKADIDRCWAKYGLSMLECSRDKLMEEAIPHADHNDDKRTESNTNEGQNRDGSNDAGENSASTPENNDSEGGKDKLLFNLEVTSSETQVTDQYLKNFAEAREVFLFIQKKLGTAKNFYVVDGHCSDYIEIVQDHSNAYKQLAFYDLDLQRQCQMHKRRIDLIQDVIADLNKQFYLLVFRQLTYELAETYSQMADLKLAMSEESGQPSSHLILKINQLARKSIEQYNEYLKSLESPDGKLPKKFAEDDERPALVAHFCIGRLHSRVVTSDITERIACIKRSLDYYSYIVDYVDKNPESRGKILSEVEICEEMKVLLPVKMDRILSGTLA